MSTLITVHGTFAHIDGASNNNTTNGESDADWWQPGTQFLNGLRDQVQGDQGPLNIEPFIWSGDNTENERRAAGQRLYNRLVELEDKSEKYCLIGHSHGGSVISHALLQSVIRKTPLNNMQRWITVGTPFVELRKERFLFLRLPLIFKALFVASLMLSLMYAFSTTSELIYQDARFAMPYKVWRIILSGVVAALPFIIFYFVANMIDRRKLFRYQKNHIQIAKKLYESKWVPLVHEDDEAIAGLGSLGTIRFSIFSKEFAVPVLTMASVFILPLAYLYIVTSPNLMMGFTNYLKKNVYQLEELEGTREKFYTQYRKVRAIRRNLRRARREREKVSPNLQPDFEGEAKVKKLQKQLRQERKKLRQAFPNALDLGRAARFSRRFLEQNGTNTCKKGNLRYCGTSVPLNAKLLFQWVTADATDWLLNEDLRSPTVPIYVAYILAIILVPMIFGLIAVALVLLVQLFAVLISRFASTWLDKMTWFQIHRSALGNDTEQEVAVSVARRPPWTTKKVNCLPKPIGDKITEHSNLEMTASLGKFRNAISELAFTGAKQSKSNDILNYLSWRELIHTSYFNVPEFSHLVARALSQVDGFTPTRSFKADPKFVETEMWLAAVGVPPTDDKA